MPTNPAESNRVTITQAARELRVARGTIYAALRLEGAPIARDGRYDIDQLREHLFENAPEAGPALLEREMLEASERCRQMLAIMAVQRVVEAELGEELTPKVRRAFEKGWTAYRAAQGKH